jgi:hypothetical protein
MASQPAACIWAHQQPCNTFADSLLFETCLLWRRTRLTATEVMDPTLAENAPLATSAIGLQGK